MLYFQDTAGDDRTSSSQHQKASADKKAKNKPNIISKKKSDKKSLTSKTTSKSDGKSKVKKTALLKVSIPFGYRIPFYLGVRRDAYTKNVYDPSGACTANFELKLMGGIPTVFPNSGPKKPGVYIFSASAKISRFHRPRNYDIFRSR